MVHEIIDILFTKIQALVHMYNNIYISGYQKSIKRK